MWPWGHLAVGYLAYAGWLDRRFARSPGDLQAVVLVLATQLPDLIDKPFAWYLGVLPNGRSLTHSALVAGVLIAVVALLARRYHREDLTAPFAIGYVFHIAADGLDPFLAGRWDELAYLLWPVLPPVPYTGSESLLERFTTLFVDLAAGDISAMLALEFVLVALAGLLWASHGFPGIPRR